MNRNPKTESFTVKDGVIFGVAAAVRSDDIEFMLVAGDMTQLKAAWFQLCTIPLNEEQAIKVRISRQP
jgi:hypothetical protein